MTLKRGAASLRLRLLSTTPPVAPLNPATASFYAEKDEERQASTDRTLEDEDTEGKFQWKITSDMHYHRTAAIGASGNFPWFMRILRTYSILT